tara:strand:+ start:349 stop:675 length:327 start_codon:yes stop_codon:yes gene_type:complete
MSRMDRISELIRGTSGIIHCEVLDESSGHNVPMGSETHFKLVAVGDVFVQKSRIQRHRMINAMLQVEFESGMHACSMHLFTPEEWEASSDVPDSPECVNARKKDSARE